MKRDNDSYYELMGEKQQLYSQSSKTSFIESIAKRKTFVNGRICPYCKSHHIVKRGPYRGRNRYECKDCGKTYNDLTGTPFANIHDLDKAEKYIECMIAGTTIRAAAKIVGISVSTSFSWRHKFLDYINKLPSPKMENVTEATDFQQNYSAKGQRKPVSESTKKQKVSVVIFTDRNNHQDSDCVIKKRIDTNPVFARIINHQNPHQEIICPKHTVFIQHVKTPAFVKKGSSYKSNVIAENVRNNWENWMFRFYGVATTYLRNYLHWYNFLNNSIDKEDRVKSFANLLMKY
jgi:transposase-like protein